MGILYDFVRESRAKIRLSELNEVQDESRFCSLQEQGSLCFCRKVFPHGLSRGEEIAHTFHSVLCTGCLVAAAVPDLWKDRGFLFFVRTLFGGLSLQKRGSYAKL